jgi:alginate O-acetyltransferase complex protein AlgI
MLFPTFAFALFFLVVYAGHWTLRDRPRAWKPFMLAASYVFYGYWDWRFLGLIAGSSVLNHLVAVAMARRRAGQPIGRLLGVAALVLAGLPAAAHLFATRLGGLRLLAGWLARAGVAAPEAAAFAGFWLAAGTLTFLAAGRVVDRHPPAAAATPARRPRRDPVMLALIVAAVAGNLGSIAFFKYAQFLAEQAMRLSLFVSSDVAHWLPVLDYLGDVILPVGISFFTFQAMSYVIDVYRGLMPPAARLFDFSIYLAFFPQLVAGPIVRARVLLPQVAERPRVTRLDSGRAAVLILSGLFKKVVIANLLAERIVDPVFAHPEAFGALDTLLAVYGYAIQIYCDFSAYSDIAIGAALLLGFRFPINFDAPYVAVSIQDFWRRWHISLSTWLRDYLYIPLGGSRVGRPRVLANLMITFLLGGLWHGAGWTFIAWGALHGVYLCAERLLGLANGGRARGRGRVLRLARIAVTIHLVSLSWIFFRAETFADAWTMLGRFGAWTRPELVSWTVLAAIAVGFATQLLDGARLERLWDAFSRRPVWVQAAVAALVLTAILGLGPKGVAPFIYFQF